MPRRYHYYPDVFQIWHILSSGGAVILAVAYLMPLVYLGLVACLRRKGAGQSVACDRPGMADDVAAAEAELSVDRHGSTPIRTIITTSAAPRKPADEARAQPQGDST